MFQNLKTRVGNMAAALKKYNPLQNNKKNI